MIEVAPSPDGACVVAILADPTTENHTSLVSFTFDGHSASNMTTLIAPTTDFDLRGLFWTTIQVGTETLLVADDRPSSSGFPVHTFEASSCVLTAARDLFVETVPALGFSN